MLAMEEAHTGSAVLKREEVLAMVSYRGGLCWQCFPDEEAGADNAVQERGGWFRQCCCNGCLAAMLPPFLWHVISGPQGAARAHGRQPCPPSGRS